MAVVDLDGEKINNRDAFHDACKAAFGFPDFYGRNMDAWIDCMSTLRDDDGMTKFKLGPDETLEIRLLHSDTLRQPAPDILRVVQECASAVNQRYVENGEKPALVLALL
jgi:RNAse (barnase) inhibitor barstar